MKLNPVLRIIPIVYDTLPHKERFLTFCNKIAQHINSHQLFKYHVFEAVVAEDLIPFLTYLIEDIIPPKNFRYNANDAWQTVDSKLRWRLSKLQTSEPVKEGEDLCYPNIDKGDLLLGLIPAAVRTTPEIWAQENHFGHGGEYFGSQLKVMKFPYHITLLDEDGSVTKTFFIEHDEQRIAHDIVSNITQEQKNKGVRSQHLTSQRGYDIGHWQNAWRVNRHGKAPSNTIPWGFLSRHISG